MCDNEIQEINIVTRIQDNGDGGYTVHCYNSEEELLDDHPLRKRYDHETGSFYNVELTSKQKEEILTEYDPYNNGYIGRATMQIHIYNGIAKLWHTFSIHAGQ